MRLFACVLTRRCPGFLADEGRKCGVKLAEQYTDGMSHDEERRVHAPGGCQDTSTRACGGFADAIIC